MFSAFIGNTVRRIETCKKNKGETLIVIIIVIVVVVVVLIAYFLAQDWA